MKRPIFPTSPGTALLKGCSRSGHHPFREHNFSIFARCAEAELEICDSSGSDSLARFSLRPEVHKTGDVWHIGVRDLPDEFSYTWRFGSGGAPATCDPLAEHLAGPHLWGQGAVNSASKAPSHTHALVPAETPFDWGEETRPHLSWNQVVLYEVHVRGFTQHPSSATSSGGTFAGLREKLPYLKWLGVTSIELLPIFEFSEIDLQHRDAKSASRVDYWGYSPLHFFAPMRAFANPPTSPRARLELKELVRRAHSLNMEVLLDVVYNHTGEGNEKGPSISLKGLSKEAYYLLDDRNEYLNYSGCGNTLNTNHPATCDLIIASLRHFASEYRIDGFRFDLATLLMRSPENALQERSALLRAIARDPLLSRVKLIAEPWDPSGTYRVGNFPFGDRFRDWNDRFRDDVRRFVNFGRGKGAFATRLCGSQDLFGSREPTSSVNFITCHDGFALRDLVTFSQKRNRENGEENRDGSDNNISCNCGEEGKSVDAGVLQLRDKQMKNFLVALMISQGVPMLLSGDEYGHTKEGNNNSWCQDNSTNWFRWDLLGECSHLLLARHLIALRRTKLPLFERFLTDQNARWHGLMPDNPLWEQEDGCLALTLLGEREELYIAFNFSERSVDFTPPLPQRAHLWALSVDTGKKTPCDFCEIGSERELTEQRVHLVDHSAVLLIAKP